MIAQLRDNLLTFQVREILFGLLQGLNGDVPRFCESLTSGNVKVTLTIAPVGMSSTDTLALSPMEQNVIEALREADGPLTGEQIAKLAGYPWDSRIRGCLAAMRRRGLIDNRQPGGYFLTEGVVP